MKEYPLNNSIALDQIRELLGLAPQTPCADVVRAVEELKQSAASPKH